MDGMVMRLDSLGRPAWIAAMVLGFVLFWPVGLALLAYMIFSGRMGCRQNGNSAAMFGHSMAGNWGGNAQIWENNMGLMQEKFARWGGCRNGWRNRDARSGFAPTGNRAFDEYRAETIRRLEDEAGEFRDFLERLRHAKDKAEFDQFMADRRKEDSNDVKDVTPRGN